MAPPRLVLELTPEDLRRLRGEEEEEEKQAAARAARAKQVRPRCSVFGVVERRR